MQNLDKQSIQEIKAFQNNELKKLMVYLAEQSTFYKKHFAKHNIDISTVSLSNLATIPPTTKDDLHANNWDFLCVPKNKIAEYCSTSGTLGLPVTIALTANDLERLAYNEYLSFLQTECTSDDVFQLMLTMEKQFMAGIAYYSGIQKLGAAAIRIGAGNMSLQLDSIIRNQPTVLIAVPSFILKMIEYASHNNIDLNKTSVKKIICIGESIRNTDFSLNELANRITTQWNVQLFSTYASTEKQTAFTECTAHKGSHAHAALIIFEILDENNQPLQPGEYGELTITTLGIEGMPLLRYKTGDICTYYDEPCSCSTNSYRLSQIVGRKKQLIKFKGTTLYPTTIYNTLNSIQDIEDYFISVNTNDIETDDVHIFIALKEKTQSNPQNMIKIIQSSLRVLPEISIISIEEVLHLQSKISNRKLNKFQDNRIP